MAVHNIDQKHVEEFLTFVHTCSNTHLSTLQTSWLEPRTICRTTLIRPYQIPSSLSLPYCNLTVTVAPLSHSPGLCPGGHQAGCSV